MQIIARPCVKTDSPATEPIDPHNHTKHFQPSSNIALQRLHKYDLSHIAIRFGHSCELNWKTMYAFQIDTPPQQSASKISTKLVCAPEPPKSRLNTHHTANIINSGFT